MSFGYLYDQTESSFKMYLNQLKNILSYGPEIIICDREQNGLSVSKANQVLDERFKVLSGIIPPGIYKDYNSLAKLDRNTLYKLLNMLDEEKAQKILRFFIKVLYRLSH